MMIDSALSEEQRLIIMWVLVYLFYNDSWPDFIFFIFFFFIQFNVPFKIISLIETSQSVGRAKREYPGKTTRHTRKQNLACLTCG